MKRLFISTILLLNISLAFSQQVRVSPADEPVAPPAPVEDSMVFTKVEVEAHFPGGQTAWSTYLSKNLKTEFPARTPTGAYSVLVRFVVSKKGQVTNIEALSKNGYGMEENVIRVIKNGPNWVPAYQNGKAVNAIRIQPVSFLVTK